MSIAEKHTVICPKCSKTQEQEKWQSINVSMDGEMKERIRRGDLNVFVCSNCGAKRRIECPVLYHHMHGNVMIWSLPGAQPVGQLNAEDEQLQQVFGLGQSGLLQFVWQGRTAPAIPIAITNTSHHLSVFRTAFGETVLKTPRF